MNKLKNKALAILRWSEKYTKTDMVYLAKGGTWGMVSQISVALMTFGLTIAFAHLVPKETYGQYKYILSIVSLLGTLTLSGIGMATLQSISRGYEGTLGYAFWQNIKWSVFFFSGAGIISIYYFLQGNLVLGMSMLVVGCLWPFFNSTNLYNQLLIAKKDFRRVTIYFDILGNLVPYLALFITMFFTKNPLWFVIVYIISNTVVGLISYKKIISIYKPNKKTDPEMMGYSKHLSFMGIIMGIADNLDQVLVFHYVGASQLAIYNFAIAIPDQIKSPIKNIANLLFPKFAKRTDADIRYGMKNKFFILFIMSIILVTAYIFIAPFIFHIFFPKYSESIIYSQIFSISLLWIISIPANTYLNAKKKIKELYIVSMFGSVLQIIILFIGVIQWGLLGLIIARVAIRLIWGIMSILLYIKLPVKTT